MNTRKNTPNLPVEELKCATEKDLEDLDGLMHELSATSSCTREKLDKVMCDENAHLYIIRDETCIIAAATLCVAHTPEFTLGFIEAVVVSEKYRGRQFGKKIMQHVIEQAQDLGIASLHLTSNPRREAANALYRSLGFQSYETNVYQYKVS